MIGYLRGQVLIKDSNYCIIDVGGVGYRVFASAATVNNLQINGEASLFIHTSVREDAIILYGFSSKEEYDIFQLLISVSGIGPKVALGILSSITVKSLILAIYEKKSVVLTKLPGIGKKSAERIILELKDKVSIGDMEINSEDIDYSPVEMDDSAKGEARAALISLGYTGSEVDAVLGGIDGNKSVQNIIKLALKEFNKFS